MNSIQETITLTGSQAQVLAFFKVHPEVFIFIVLWVVIWKATALWRAARLSHKWWFIILVVVNTLGILEIIYIFLVARKYTVESEVEPVKEK